MLCLLTISPTHSACYTVQMGVRAGDLTRITPDNNHTAYKHICLQVIGFVCVKKYPPEIMQSSSSTRATIVSAENQNGVTIVKATFFFCHYYIVWESNNAGEARGQSWNESLNPDESQEDRAVIRVVQSENILLRFLRRGHADDGCSCNHRAPPPPIYSFWLQHTYLLIIRCMAETQRESCLIWQTWFICTLTMTPPIFLEI